MSSWVRLQSDVTFCAAFRGDFRGEFLYGPAMRTLLCLVLLGATSALAIGPGDPLWLARDAPLRKEAKPKSTALVTLKAGAEVRWLGVDAKDQRFHRVSTADQKTGFVLLTELAPAKPQAELDGSGKSIDPRAFSAGTVTKGTPPMNAERQPELDALTELNAKAATPEALEKKRQELTEAR